MLVSVKQGVTSIPGVCGVWGQLWYLGQNFPVLLGLGGTEHPFPCELSRGLFVVVKAF